MPVSRGDIYDNGLELIHVISDMREAFRRAGVDLYSSKHLIDANLTEEKGEVALFKGACQLVFSSGANDGVSYHDYNHYYNTGDVAEGKTSYPYKGEVHEVVITEPNAFLLAGLMHDIFLKFQVDSTGERWAITFPTDMPAKDTIIDLMAEARIAAESAPGFVLGKPGADEEVSFQFGMRLMEKLHLSPEMNIEMGTMILLTKHFGKENSMEDINAVIDRAVEVYREVSGNSGYELPPEARERITERAPVFAACDLKSFNTAQPGTLTAEDCIQFYKGTLDNCFESINPALRKAEAVVTPKHWLSQVNAAQCVEAMAPNTGFMGYLSAAGDFKYVQSEDDAKALSRNSMLTSTLVMGAAVYASAHPNPLMPGMPMGFSTGIFGNAAPLHETPAEFALPEKVLEELGKTNPVLAKVAALARHVGYEKLFEIGKSHAELINTMAEQGVPVPEAGERAEALAAMRKDIKSTMQSLGGERDTSHEHGRS